MGILMAHHCQFTHQRIIPTPSATSHVTRHLYYHVLTETVLSFPESLVHLQVLLTTPWPDCRKVHWPLRGWLSVRALAVEIGFFVTASLGDRTHSGWINPLHNAFHPVPASCVLGTKCSGLYGCLHKWEPRRPPQFETVDIPSHWMVTEGKNTPSDTGFLGFHMMAC